jgi:hypothetical protein
VDLGDLVVLVITFTLTRVSGNLHGEFVALVMDPSLVKNVEIVGHTRSQILIRHTNLEECDGGEVYFLAKKILLDDLATRRQFLAQSFHL